VKWGKRSFLTHSCYRIWFFISIFLNQKTQSNSSKYFFGFNALTYHIGDLPHIPQGCTTFVWGETRINTHIISKKRIFGHFLLLFGSSIWCSWGGIYSCFTTHGFRSFHHYCLLLSYFLPSTRIAPLFVSNLRTMFLLLRQHLSWLVNARLIFSLTLGLSFLVFPCLNQFRLMTILSKYGPLQEVWWECKIPLFYISHLIWIASGSSEESMPFISMLLLFSAERPKVSISEGILPLHVAIPSPSKVMPILQIGIQTLMEWVKWKNSDGRCISEFCLSMIPRISSMENVTHTSKLLASLFKYLSSPSSSRYFWIGMILSTLLRLVFTSWGKGLK